MYQEAGDLFRADDEKISGANYRSVLGKNLLNLLKILGKDPKNIVQATIEWLRSKHIHESKQHSQSPDINLFRNLQNLFLNPFPVFLTENFNFILA